MKDKRRDELLDILNMLLEEELDWFELRTPSVYIRLGSGPGVLSQPMPSPDGDGQGTLAPAPVPAPAVAQPLPGHGRYQEVFDRSGDTPDPARGGTSPSGHPQGLLERGKAAPSAVAEHLVTAPFAGTFYRRPSPTDPPFVEVGSRVCAEDPVCLVEVMKLFNSVHAGADGIVTAIEVSDGELVEYGQVLMRIAPEARG